MLPIEARQGLRKFYPEMLEENDTIEMEEIQDDKEETNDNNYKESESNRALEIEEPIEETRAIKTMPRKDFDTRAVKMSLDTAEEILKSDISDTMKKIMKSVKKDLTKLNDEKKYNDIQNYNFKYKNELESHFVNSSRKLFADGTKFVNQSVNKRADFGSNLSDYLRMAVVKAKSDSTKYILDLQEKIKIQVLEAISKKKSNNDIIGVIEKAFQEKEVATPTVLRTVTTNFYNMGIDQQIQKVKEFVPMVQFSAVLDDVTTDRCTRLDGLIVAVDSADYERIRPPLHFNCRSVLIPVTEIDIEDNPELGVPTKSNELNKILTNTPGFEVI